MSHYAVAVITDSVEKLEYILAPYEEKEVPRYMSKTKEQVIADARASFQKYITTGYYAQWKADPVAYVKKGVTEEHLNYLKNEVPLRMTWTDEDWYRNKASSMGPENIGADGEFYSTYNPKSKWDWYAIGGRWKDMLELTDISVKVDYAKIKHIKNITDIPNKVYACITTDGEWHAPGKMGWWGCSTATEETRNDFKTFFSDTLKNADPEHYMIIVDFHI